MRDEKSIFISILVKANPSPTWLVNDDNCKELCFKNIYTNTTLMNLWIFLRILPLMNQKNHIIESKQVY
jgi:hypothetical protein